ncbi:unnamed protein product, partial [Rotaria sp. Silwood2]
YDERNFHCWAYRYYLLERLCPSSLSSELEGFYENELSFLRSTIGINLSNYSAWHYRSKYLDKLIDHNPSRRTSLLSRIESINEDEHIKPLEELDDIESNNKWCMLTLCQLWKENNYKNDKRINYLEQLANQIDPDRAQFYKDQI